MSIEPIRVLHVISGLGSGGAESFIMNMYRHMDHSVIQFDFLLRSDENNYEYELNETGSKIYRTASFPRHWLKNLKQTAQFFQHNHYPIIHIHANALLYMTALIIAKKYGVPCRIVHSHNAAMADMRLMPLHSYNKKRIHQLATDCFACSDEAGEWMFENNYQIIHNAIDIEKFKFDPVARVQIRNEFGIEQNAFVIGHVGRFWDQKNHEFLMNIFYKIVQQRPNSILVMVGEGGKEKSIKQLAKELKIEKQVVFAGARNDVNKVMSAFDVFAFPSIYEGLGIVAVEAQANGLPTVCSEAVPDSVIFTDHAEKIPLAVGVDTWCERLLDMEKSRYDASAAIRNAGYDIREEAKKLQNFYCAAAKRK